MTNHNNASETSGEAEIVERLEDRAKFYDDSDDCPVYHEHDKELDLASAETIQRLVAERDDALDAEYTTKDYFWQVYEKYLELTDVPIDFKDMEPNWKARAEAAETRMMVLLQERDAARQEYHACCVENDTLRDDINLFRKRIAELEADLQRAREALAHVRNLAELMMHGDASYLNTILDIISAAMKGKQL
jgi:hypothetical protein